MASFEIEHPLGRDIDAIHGAAIVGLSDVIKQNAPERLKVDYKDPLASGTGVAGIRIADWATENVTAIYYPIAVEPNDTTWQVYCEDGIVPVLQRIYTCDLLGRGFPLSIGGDSFVSKYLQFDITEAGIVLSGEDAGEQKLVYGGFEGENYERISIMARHQASIQAVLAYAQAA